MNIYDQISDAEKLLFEAINILSKIKPDPVSKTIKVAIVVGHSKDRSGSSNLDHGMSEYTFNYPISDNIVHRLNKASHNVEGVEVLRKTGLGDLIKEVNATGADLCISLHCNAFNRTVSGCETLYYHRSKQGKVFAEIVQAELFELMDNSDRGIKPKSSEERGGWLLRETNMPCVIAEPFFIDEESDYKLGMKYRDDGQLADAYTKAILKMVKKL